MHSTKKCGVQQNRVKSGNGGVVFLTDLERDTLRESTIDLQEGFKEGVKGMPVRLVRVYSV